MLKKQEVWGQEKEPSQSDLRRREDPSGAEMVHDACGQTELDWGEVENRKGQLLGTKAGPLLASLSSPSSASAYVRIRMTARKGSVCFTLERGTGCYLTRTLYAPIPGHVQSDRTNPASG